MRNDLTYIAVVLDRSGSMGDVKRQTIDGFNEFLGKQKAEPGEARMYLAQFDDQYDLVYDKPLNEANKLDDGNYVPRGMTALYDAIGKTVDDLGHKLSKTPEQDRPGKVLVAIITDGYENASHEYGKERVRSMISEQQTKYGWKFAFIGANQDAVLSAQHIGIARQNAMTYTAANTSRVMGQSMSNYTSGLRYAASASVADPLFSDEDRKAAVAAR